MIVVDTNILVCLLLGCTAYDCEFVALSQRLGVPLVTLDRALLKAFPRLARKFAAI